MQTRKAVPGSRSGTQKVWPIGQDPAAPCLNCRRRGDQCCLWSWKWIHKEVSSILHVLDIHAHMFPSEYYDAFVSIQRGLFNTRDRVEHSRKRKIVSHTFSAKSIGQFEQYMVSLIGTVGLVYQALTPFIAWKS